MQVVVEGVHRRSQHVPVVVWIDDLQWADPLLLELLGRLTRSLVDRPVLLVTAQRDDAEIDWPPSHDHPIMIRMPLDPLSRLESDELLSCGARRFGRRRSGRPALRAERGQPAVPHPTRRGRSGSARPGGPSGLAPSAHRGAARHTSERAAPGDRQCLRARRDRPVERARAVRCRDGAAVRCGRPRRTRRQRDVRCRRSLVAIPLGRGP